MMGKGRKEGRREEERLAEEVGQCCSVTHQHSEHSGTE